MNQKIEGEQTADLIQIIWNCFDHIWRLAFDLYHFLNFSSVLNLYFKVKNVNRKTEFLLLKILVQMSVILYPGKKILYGQYFSCTCCFSLKALIWTKWYSLRQKYLFVGFLCISKDCFKQGFSWSVWLANGWSPEARVMKAVEWLHGLHTEGYF